MKYCLGEAGAKLSELDHVAFYDKPFLKFERLLETYVAFAPRGFRSFQMALPLWIREKLFQKDLLHRELAAIDAGWERPEKLLFAEHHLSHAASAFYPSPFDQALVLTLDGVGEWCTTSAGVGEGADLKIHRELHFPHSLGLLYSAFTYYTGFKVNSGEYKLMGLAPYGEPKYATLILDKLMDLKDDGTFRLDMQYFDYCTGLTMTNQRFSHLFGQPVRTPEKLLTQFHMDIAASVQKVTEEVMLRLTRSLAAETGAKNLCLAGGVALNCVANGKVLRDNKFAKDLDSTGGRRCGRRARRGAVRLSLACRQAAARTQRCRRHEWRLSRARALPKATSSGALLPPAPASRRFRSAVMIERTARDLAEGRAVGWFQGRMEFGPRALGGRSILGDARSPTMQKTLNLRVKYRESFRPFAPSVLREEVSNWFELDEDSPYMLLVAGVDNRRRREMTAAEQALFGIDKLNTVRSKSRP